METARPFDPARPAIFHTPVDLRFLVEPCSAAALAASGCGQPIGVASKPGHQPGGRKDFSPQAQHQSGDTPPCTRPR
jgi:hypothetical protein